MHSSTYILAVIAALSPIAQAIPLVNEEVQQGGSTVAPPSGSSLEKRSMTAYLCEGLNWAPPCQVWQVPYLTCHSLANTEFWHNVHEVGPNKGTTCQMYFDTNCKVEAGTEFAYPGSWFSGPWNIESITCW